jgi:hypothetical protein
MTMMKMKQLKKKKKKKKCLEIEECAETGKLRVVCFRGKSGKLLKTFGKQQKMIQVTVTSDILCPWYDLISEKETEIALNRLIH